MLLLPAAIYALCAGCAPFMHCYGGLSMSHTIVDSSEAADDWIKVCVGVDLSCHLTFGSHVYKLTPLRN